MKKKLTIVLLALSLAISAVALSACITLAPPELTLNKSELSLAVGATDTLTVTNTTGETATWSVEGGSTNVITVSSNGLVTAVASGGPINVVVKAGNLEAKCAVTVTKTVAANTITTNKATLKGAFDAIKTTINEDTYEAIEAINTAGIAAIEAADTDAQANAALNTALTGFATEIVNLVFATAEIDADEFFDDVADLLDGDLEVDFAVLEMSDVLIEAFLGEYAAANTALQNAATAAFPYSDIFEYGGKVTNLFLNYEMANLLSVYAYLDGETGAIYDIAFEGIIAEADLTADKFNDALVALVDTKSKACSTYANYSELMRNITFANYANIETLILPHVAALYSQLTPVITQAITNLTTIPETEVTEGIIAFGTRVFLYLTNYYTTEVNSIVSNATTEYLALATAFSPAELEADEVTLIDVDTILNEMCATAYISDPSVFETAMSSAVTDFLDIKTSATPDVFMASYIDTIWAEYEEGFNSVYKKIADYAFSTLLGEWWYSNGTSKIVVTYDTDFEFTKHVGASSYPLDFKCYALEDLIFVVFDGGFNDYYQVDLYSMTGALYYSYDSNFTNIQDTLTPVNPLSGSWSSGNMSLDIAIDTDGATFTFTTVVQTIEGTLEYIGPSLTDYKLVAETGETLGFIFYSHGSVAFTTDLEDCDYIYFTSAAPGGPEALIGTWYSFSGDVLFFEQGMPLILYTLIYQSGDEVYGAIYETTEPDMSYELKDYGNDLLGYIYYDADSQQIIFFSADFQTELTFTK